MARPSRRRDPFVDGQTEVVTVVDQAAVDLYYDYERIPEQHRDAVMRAAISIKPRLKRAAGDLFVIGRELRDIKSRLPHGEYTNWLDLEFGLSERMAQRFMNVHDRLGAKSDKLSVLPPSTLYLLAAPSTPDEAIQSIEGQLGRGQRLTVRYVQDAISDAKRKAKDRELSEVTIDGEVISSRVVDAEAEAEIAETVERLDEALTQAFELLSEQVGDDWAALFHNSELTRVRNEIYKLREELRKRG